METHDAVERLSALAHPSRLAVFRLLVQGGPEGLAAGAIAEAIEIPPPTLSFHLTQLARAGLVTSRREGRSVVYSADYSASGELVAFLYDNCCGGGCEPLVTLAPGTRADRRTEA